MKRKSLYSNVMLSFLIVLSLFASNQMIVAQQLAFPGAEGFAKYTTGGRGGSVYHVTNLNDSGTGSFRDAVSASNRIVVFDVAGVINISSRIVIHSNITVAGQTAPGDGITIYGNGIALNSDSGNDIIRYIRFRMGKNGDSGKDAVGISDGTDYMFDHVSISWGRDGTLDVNGTDIDNLTFQECIVSQGINNSNHSTGGLMQSGKWSIIRSLYIDNKTRNPKARGTQECINSVFYNWGTNGYIMGDTEGTSECNLIGNYFIYGPSSSSNTHITNTTPTFYVYGSDNWVDADGDGVLDGSLMTDYKTATVMSSPYSYPGVTNQLSAQNALTHVVNNVGASKVRDAVDELLINQVLSYGTAGVIVNTEDDNGIDGNVGTVESGLAPLDTDQDGMPDAWEIMNGLDATTQNHNSDADGDGYTNIEEYLEWAITNDVSTLTMDDGDDLIQEYETGFCNIEGTIDSNNDGYTGTGFFNTTNEIGAGINWYFRANGGSYTFTWRYANGGTTDRPGNLIINGSTISAVSLPATGGWTTWGTATATVALSYDVYDVRLEATTASGLANIDYMGISGSAFDIVACGSEISAGAELVKHGSGSSSQTIDYGTSIQSFYYSWSNATTASASGLPNGVAATVDNSAQTITLSGTPTEVGTFNFTVTTLGGSTNATAGGTLTINPIISSLTIQEDATGFCSVDGTVDSNNAGFTGTGFANTTNAVDMGITWSVDVPINGDYNLVWNFANGGTADRTALLMVDGSTVISNVSMPSTGSWTSWTESTISSVALSSGTHLIRLQASTSAGLSNIDYMNVTGASPEAVSCSGLKSAFLKIDNTKPLLKVYPNPTALDNITLQGYLETAGDVTVTIFDNAGKVISSELFNGFENGIFKFDMSVECCKSGVYYVRVLLDNRVEVLPLIKK